MNAKDKTNNNGNDVEESVIDQTAYPVLTESISPTGTVPSAVPAGIGQLATAAIRDVLGWNPRGDDPKGFVGALDQSFALLDVEGHTEWKWTPRTYAVQTDLSGGITGAQASIYARAREALDQSLPLLDGLYPLDTTADPQDTEALRSVVRALMKDLVEEVGNQGGPRVARVDQLFDILLGEDRTDEHIENMQATMLQNNPTLADVQWDRLRYLPMGPDEIGGELGTLRDQMGLALREHPAPGKAKRDFVNTVSEEQNATNYRILADYQIGLRQSWLENRRFFVRSKHQPPFFGTQLVLLSRQLSVVAESVDELRFALDSVFIGALERQTLEIHPQISSAEETPPQAEERSPGKKKGAKVRRDLPIFLEDLLAWIYGFVKTEAPEFIQTGGKLAMHRVLFRTTHKLELLVEGSIAPTNSRDLPQGYFTPRVKRAMRELHGQLRQLRILCEPIDHKISTTVRTPVEPEHPRSKQSHETHEATVVQPPYSEGGASGKKHP